MFGLGWPELAIILVIVLVIFGPKKLPEIGKSLGGAIRELRKSTTESVKSEEKTEEKVEANITEKPAEEVKS